MCCFHDVLNVICLYLVFFLEVMLRAFNILQECIREQEALMSLEQAARQKVTELLSVMESEKSQGSVLKAILQAKESNQIEGIYGRMGDLGAIDGEYTLYVLCILPSSGGLYSVVLNSNYSFLHNYACFPVKCCIIHIMTILC